jgi:hypothetical protein
MSLKFSYEIANCFDRACWLRGRTKSVSDISRLFQAFLAPALFVSATALLILSIKVRLMGIVSRLRQYVHAKHDAAQNGRVAEADAYTSQIESIEQRAELIRRCFLLALMSLAGMIASCQLLGFGLYCQKAALHRGDCVRDGDDCAAGGGWLLPSRSECGAQFGA